MNDTQNPQADWLTWLSEYGASRFLDSFLKNVEGAESRCLYCCEYIYVDLLTGGGVANWSTKEGDFGCNHPNSFDGSHMPLKR